MLKSWIEMCGVFSAMQNKGFRIDDQSQKLSYLKTVHFRHGKDLQDPVGCCTGCTCTCILFTTCFSLATGTDELCTNLQVCCLTRNLSLSSFRAVANLSDELLLLLSAAFCINEQRGCVGCKVNITLKDNRYLFSILLPRIHRFKTLRIRPCWTDLTTRDAYFGTCLDDTYSTMLN